MPAFDYGAMQTLALSLLSQFKQGAVSLIQQTKGAGPSYNPGPQTQTVVSLNAVAKGVGSYYIVNGLANVGDLEVTSAVVAGVTVDQINDKIDLPDGSRWKIVSFQKIPAAGTPVVWKFIVRR